MKRNREEIISQILNVCRNGAIKTRVVYQANLNFKTVEPYLDLLVKNNLLEVQHGEKKMYETTEKGETLLEALQSGKCALWNLVSVSGTKGHRMIVVEMVHRG